MITANGRPLSSARHSWPCGPPVPGSASLVISPALSDKRRPGSRVHADRTSKPQPFTGLLPVHLPDRVSPFGTSLQWSTSRFVDAFLAGWPAINHLKYN
jgi:hypothetical protein